MEFFILQLMLFVFSTVASTMLAPKPAVPKPANFSELEVPTAETGKPIPVVFGTYIIQSPNVVWYGDLAYAPIKTKGGK